MWRGTTSINPFVQFSELSLLHAWQLLTYTGQLGCATSVGTGGAMWGIFGIWQDFRRTLPAQRGPGSAKERARHQAGFFSLSALLQRVDYTPPLVGHCCDVGPSVLGKPYQGKLSPRAACCALAGNSCCPSALDASDDASQRFDRRHGVQPICADSYCWRMD